MPFKIRVPLLLLICFLACHLPGKSDIAHAQGLSTPNAFAPWMEIEGSPQVIGNNENNNGFSYNKDSQNNPETRQDKNNNIKDNSKILPPSSALEQTYSNRIIDELQQFGYGMFKKATTGDTPTSFALPSGAVQDDFVLNTGDTLDITFRGQRKDRGSYTIGNDGYLIINGIPPIPAAGKTIRYVQAVLQNHTDQLHNTESYVSLSGIKQINVLIIGHVAKPGRRVLTVFHSVLDALIESGGIEKTGSLRQVKLIRDGRSTIIDLYGLLIHGSDNMDISLRDGDRLIIPPIGPTIAIAGNVKRPGVYEILPELQGMKHKPGEVSQKLSLQDLLDFSGGPLSAGQNRFLKLGLTADGRETVEEISDSFKPTFSDSSILMVMASDEKRAGTVELAGHTRQPGLHALTTAPTLSALLSDEKIFGPDIYPLIGIIERWDTDRMATRLKAFPPRLVVKGQYDERLQNGDVIHLFSRSQILGLNDEDKNKKLNRQHPQRAEGSAPELKDEKGDTISDEIIRSFLQEHSVTLRGAVRQEGQYPVTEHSTLDVLLAVAGGMTLEADTSNIELTAKNASLEQTGNTNLLQRKRIDLTETTAKTIQPGPSATVRVNRKFQKIIDNSVLIIGEVANPGRYDLMPGDRLSDLIRRADGLNAQAYPEGAIFSRENERKAEEARFRAQARDLELKLAAALEQKDDPDMVQVEAVQHLITRLQNAESVGRITVEADPSALTVQPELDILLEKGDRIYIPKRPLTVRVSGEVLSAANLQFRSNKTAEDYINEAGGLTKSADDDRIFVLYPDGSAQPLITSPWKHNAVLIPPGSTIVVPHDPKPFDFIETAKDVTQILTNLAITGIFIDDIRD